jgi:DNA-binding transcriptional LysR family regulator
LADAGEPLRDEVIRQHRAVAVADSVAQGNGLSIGLLAGQDVFTVPDMPAKLDAQIRGLGAGFLPTCLAQPYIDKGQRARQGRALQWWLARLQSPVTRVALLGERPGSFLPAATPVARDRGTHAGRRKVGSQRQ